MDTKTIVPEGWETWAHEWQYAPARIAGDLIYVSGCTAEQTDGAIPNDTEEQMRLAFKNVRRVLEAAGASLADVVEMTTYHVGLQGHVELFARIKDEFLHEPYPAWTAIGITELLTPGAVVEIRVTARRPGAGP